MILFRATSHHQLINAIAIKLRERPSETADLMLSNMTDFSPYLDNIRQTGIFRKVYYVDDLAVAKEFLALNQKDRLTWSKKIDNKWNIELDCSYTDYYYGYEIMCNKLFYYYLIGKQNAIIAHAFQEGVSSYTVDMFRRRNDSINHAYYGKKALNNCIEDLYFYWPDTLLFPPLVEVKQLTTNDEAIKQAIKRIYRPNPLPREKFIYIAGCIEFQNVSSNEYDLLYKLEQCVGKENIVIKSHPRFPIDKFSRLGYSVMDGKTAWEAYVLDDSIANKVLISAISTALFSSYNIRSDITGLMLNNMFSCDLSRFVNNNSLKRYFTSARKKVQEIGGTLYEPTSYDDLKECLIYLKNQ